MGYTYGEVEDAIMSVLQIPQHERSKVTARIRHFRNIGISPPLPNPGSGMRIQYSIEQACEILLAAELLRLGITPRRSLKMIATSIKKGSVEIKTRFSKLEINVKSALGALTDHFSLKKAA